MSIASTVPASIQAGDTITWRRELPQYPASDGWVLSYRIINAGNRIDVVATADADAHLVTISAATTGSYVAGQYTAVEYVTRGTDRHTLGSGTITVLQDLAAMSAGYDARGEAQRALDDLRAALRRWLSSQGQVQEYEIAGRRMRFASAQEINSRIALAEREVLREQAASGMAGALPARRVLVRF